MGGATATGSRKWQTAIFLGGGLFADYLIILSVLNGASLLDADLVVSIQGRDPIQCSLACIATCAQHCQKA